MVTPTLFDIAAITGLRPTGEMFYPNGREEDAISLNTNHASFGKYIEDYHGTDNPEVSNE